MGLWGRKNTVSNFVVNFMLILCDENIFELNDLTETSYFLYFLIIAENLWYPRI